MPATKRPVPAAPEPEAIRRSLPLLLLQAREAVMEHFRPLLREHGVSEQQWRVIRALKSEGPLEIGRLADICSLHGPSLTGMLGRMEQAAYVQRRRRAEDQRVVIVELQPAAEALFEAMREGMQTQYRLLEKKLGRQDLARLYQTLDELVAKLTE
ncbi:homoprotocatechuate degradation operon regulator HpaR [Roseateles sp. DAIF2]|uniref:homoprotocatechuate degradation operon regulator HpaR n=1 Tax=Roseateles sp. DAIF2 TaxID=2714952 RepID=UPI0018A2E67D|nr:homoprotocatechuate degradation operon regulator HpaR [Roseateles sp. DAIF2]QPF75879.1 homoprotocatechuate degradation operon regulator HpaR [Roseateles sp. DAIF2]